MRTIFLADAHLDEPSEPRYRLLLRFLRELEGNTETLYVLGDLFDFWLGFSSNPFSQYDDVLEALQALVNSGCRLVYFEGNHDFHLGPIFSQRLKADIHSGPGVVTVQGRRLYLCHGDQIHRADYGYRLLRLLLHNRVMAAAIRYVPLPVAQYVRTFLQRRSHASYLIKKQRWNYPEIIRTFARTVRDQGCDGMVCGHFHNASCENLDGTPFTVLCLGDWLEQFSYGEMVSGTLYLKSYQMH